MRNATGIVRMGLICRNTAIGIEQFGAHWRGPHGTLAAAMPGLVGYHQNHRVARFPIAGRADRWMLDGLSELWFPSIEAMRRAVTSSAYTPVAADTPCVMTMPGIIAGTQVGRGPANAITAGDKLMLVAARAAGIDADTFTRRWDGGLITTGLAGVSHAVDTFVTHRETAPGIEVDREELPLDLVVELWFEDTATLQSAARQLAESLGEAAGHLLGDVALYRTRTHVVVDRRTAASGAIQ